MFKDFDFKAVGIAFAGILFASLLSAQASFLLSNLQLSLSPAPDEAAVAEEAAQPFIGENRLLIPALDIDVPIAYAAEKNEASYQEALEHGVGHFPDTALPGEPGNVFLFGHSSDFSWSKGAYKTVFATLPRIEVGDLAIASGPDGVPHAYRVVETRVVLPTETDILSQETDGRHVLTLQTSYPLGTALKRFIAIAEETEDLPELPAPPDAPLETDVEATF